MQGPGVGELQRLESEALEMYREVVHSRKLKRVLKQQVRADPGPFEPGESVLFQRKNKESEKPEWHGPGQVIGNHTLQGGGEAYVWIDKGCIDQV